MRILLLCLIPLLAACQSRGVLPPPAPIAPEGRDHAQLGQIVELASGQVITPQQLVERLAKAPRVLVGIEHLQQQARVEQVQADVRAGRAPRDTFAALAWQPGWDWGLYGALVQYQLRQPYPLLAANLDRAEIMQIYQARPTLQGTASTAPAVQEKLQADIRESHCGLLPDSQIPAMLAVQQQRDRRMAERLLAAPQPAILLAGAFHVRKDLGVPLHLADLGAGVGNLVLILAEVGKQPAADSADYVWYTAANAPEDHCAKLRKK